MGNYRFKFSDMIPNGWFYKLKDASKATSSSSLKKTPAARMAGSSPVRQEQATEPSPLQPRCQPGRASYYFPTRQEKLPSSSVRLGGSGSAFVIEPHRRSKKKTQKKHARSPMVAGCSCHSTVWKTAATTGFSLAPYSSTDNGGGAGDDDDDGDDDYEGVPCADKPVIAEHNERDNPVIAEHYGSDSIAAFPRSSSCRFTSSATDIILDMRSKSSPGREMQETEDIYGIPELVLPPILTKPAKPEVNPRKMDDDGSGSARDCYHELGASPPSREHRKSVRIHGLRMRACSPRLAGKKIRHRKAGGPSTRKFLAESFAVVKNSSDPRRDFRDSMMEMIVENNIRASKDLEDLLACYLSLNSNEYHDVIVKVFEQIWFDLTNLRLPGSP